MTADDPREPAATPAELAPLYDELEALRYELAELDDSTPALASITRLATIVDQICARSSVDAAALPARDDRLLLEGLRAFAARAQEPGANGEVARCWFGVSAEDGLPWMYCATAGVARDALAALARLQGTT
jgi:hypothetical protein